MSAQPLLTDRIPTWRFNLATIGFALRPFLIHSAFTLLIFFKDTLPGLIIKSIFDTISHVPEAQPIVPPLFGIDSLWWAVGLYALIGVVQVALGIGYEWYGWTFRSRVATVLTGNVFSSILRRRGDETLPISSGEAVNRFHSDIGEVADFPLWIPDQLGKWIAAIFAVIIMIRINLTITLVIFLPLIGIMFITRLAWKRINRYVWESTRATDRVEGFLGEIFGAVQAIKVAGTEAEVVDRFLNLNERRRQTQMRLNLVEGLLTSLNQSVVTFGIGVMLLMAGQAISAGNFGVGDFALFVSYLWFTTQVPPELGVFYGDYKNQEISIERLLEMVRPEPTAGLLVNHPVNQHTPSPVIVFPRKTRTDCLETLEVRDLTYLFPNGNGQSSEPNGGRGITDINFSIRRGEIIAITGRIGSGKTTLLRALLGLITAQQGEILWNNRCISDPASFFRPPYAAYVAQVPRLFSDSLRENILLGLPEEKVDLPGSLYLTVMEPDVAGLGNGLDTLVGPRGVRLSGGQVQRAAVARLFVRDPELMVVDDLSSALDVETERLLWDRIESRRAANNDITCLVVTNRRTVLRHANRVIILRKGRIMSEGTLDELLKTNDEMQKLWKGVV